MQPKRQIGLSSYMVICPLAKGDIKGPRKQPSNHTPADTRGQNSALPCIALSADAIGIVRVPSAPLSTPGSLYRFVEEVVLLHEFAHLFVIRLFGRSLVRQKDKVIVPVGLQLDRSKNLRHRTLIHFNHGNHVGKVEALKASVVNSTSPRR